MGGFGLQERTCSIPDMVARLRRAYQPLGPSGSNPDGRTRMAAQKKWQLTGDYFENCNCDVVCPCLVSPSAPLTPRPTQGACDVAIAFHIDRGNYDGVPLDGLNVAVVGNTPGPMADGNWNLAAYIDE